MKKLFTLFLSVFLMASAFAQKPEAIALKTDVKPALDGVLDEGLWDDCEVYNIALPFTGETPTLGDVGETNFRVLWDDDGVYIFITVTDDVLIPNFANTGTAYMYDFPEITFDVNYTLDDGLGPQEGQGHYQIDTRMLEGDGDGTPKTNPGPEDLETVAFLIDGTNYTAEYLIPFAQLITADGGLVDKTQSIGFDVYISDNDNDTDLNDPIRNRAVWTNQGEVTQAWDNMDNCGLLILDGSEPPIFVEEITISGEDITKNGQTMQIQSVVLPEDAEDKRLKWIVTSADGGVARATISEEGLVTPVLNETIIVYATSTDDFTESDPITINITGQIPTKADLSYIKNGNFDQVDSTGVPLIWQGFEAGSAIVVDGVLEFAPTEIKTNIYDYKMLQYINVPYALKDLEYVLSFKAWADEERSFQLKMEDSANGWSTYGVTSAPETDGTSFWPADLMKITTEPTVYTFDITFTNMAENCNQNFNWQVGESITKIYLDSVYLISKTDMALLPTANKEISKMDETFKVYPNPADTKLHVEFSSPNATIAIYNSVGIKMDEEVIFGTHHMFDVSRYPKGLYFVKANDAVVKFVK